MPPFKAKANNEKLSSKPEPRELPWLCACHSKIVLPPKYTNAGRNKPTAIPVNHESSLKYFFILEIPSVKFIDGFISCHVAMNRNYGYVMVI